MPKNKSEADRGISSLDMDMSLAQIEKCRAGILGGGTKEAGREQGEAKLNQQLVVWRPREKPKSPKQQICIIELPYEEESDGTAVQESQKNKEENEKLLEEVEKTLTLKRGREDNSTEKGDSTPQKRRVGGSDPKETDADNGGKRDDKYEGEEVTGIVAKMETDGAKEAGLKLPHQEP